MHDWIEREVTLDDGDYVHRVCQHCGRDFAMKKGADEWIAVHLTAFQFQPLQDSVNHRWLSEPCPGRQLLEDGNDHRVKK